MNNIPRKVKFSTIFNILRENTFPLFFGTFFGIFPLLMFIPLFFISNSTESSVPEIDYELIKKQGKITNALISNIETQYNVTINGVHPTIISYKYSEKNIESKYKVLEERKIENLKIGDTIVIKELNGNTIINDLAPYDFNDKIFFFIPLLFLLIGLPFLIYAIVKFRKKLNLYKSGEIFNGKIISMMPKPGRGFSNFGQGINVQYEYETKFGKKLIGESFTNDFSIMNDKKRNDIIPIFVSNENNEKSCVVPKLESYRNGWNIDFKEE